MNESEQKEFIKGAKQLSDEIVAFLGSKEVSVSTVSLALSITLCATQQAMNENTAEAVFKEILGAVQHEVERNGF